MSAVELGREISLSASATRERLRRFHELNVIRGYTAIVDPGSLGYGFTAFARVRLGPSGARSLLEHIAQEPRIVEAHHLTGEDCYLVRVVGEDMGSLERISDALATFGQVSFQVAFSSPVRQRPIPAPAVVPNGTTA